MVAFLALAAVCAVTVVVVVLVYVFRESVAVGKIRNLLELVQLLFMLKYHAVTMNGKHWSFVDNFERLVDTTADVIQFIFVENDEHVSRSGLERRANQIAHWSQSSTVNLKQHDTVALMMLNRSDFVAFWLGVSKAGVRTALLNTNITGKAFLHSVTVSVESSTAKILIVDEELRDVLSSEVEELRKQGITVYFWDVVSKQLADLPTTRPPKSWRSTVKESDPFLYIFTSGTTGLPKASKISHTRYYLGCIPMPVVCYLRPGDRVYNCLPLYHSAAGMLGVGGTLTSGATLVTRRKFSARAFTADILKYNCTSVQYIGELCRYLMNTPPNPLDEKLNIKYAIGNGLRPDVWGKFQDRYHVKRVIEFYGATEGNVNMFSSTGQRGALGYMPILLSELFYPVKIFKVSEEDKSVPIRGENGYCIPAAYGEVGLIMNVIDNKVVERRFDGYSDSGESNKKLITNVLRQGDCYFNSGDLLSRTSEGFYYWSDRVGDTFRWKGENVATTEIESVLSAHKDFSDVAAFGVSVPHCDGKVGMLCVVLNEGVTSSTIDWAAFDRECVAHLPAYARPAFIRVTAIMQLTSTFKVQKAELVKQGYDLSTVADEIYFYSVRDHTVTRLTQEIVKQIQEGSLQL